MFDFLGSVSEILCGTREYMFSTLKMSQLQLKVELRGLRCTHYRTKWRWMGQVQ